MSDPALLEPQTQKGVNVDPPDRLAFEERPLKGEPATDRLLETETGRLLRERILVADARAENVVTPADPAATAFSLLISHAAVDADGAVARRDGKPIIAPAHEVVLTLEALGRLGSEAAFDESIRAAREVAAAQADRVFRGGELADRLLVGRQS